LAVAMLRHQRSVSIGPDALRQGLSVAEWPARLQRLSPGPLIGAREVWLDGGHNESAAQALAAALSGRSELHLIIGMLANKDATSFIRALAPVAASLSAVPIEGHDHHAPDQLVRIATALGLPAKAAPDIAHAIATSAGPILIAGSLYLAGTVLALNGEPPQ
jgi:dihydrofolate synthase / folylpolyglutamate synthase